MSGFETTYPTANVPALPEFMRKDTFEGMMPGQINYPYGAGPVVYDKLTGHLYVDKSEKLDPDYTAPSHFGNSRTAIMRVFATQEDGETLDGFVADMRYLAPGTMYERTIVNPVKPEDMNRLERAFEEAVAETKYTPLLAVVFKDPDGGNYFMGDPRLEDTVAYLIEQTDTIKAGTNKSATAVNAETDQKVTTTVQEIMGDYYLG